MVRVEAGGGRRQGARAAGRRAGRREGKWGKRHWGRGRDGETPERREERSGEDRERKKGEGSGWVSRKSHAI